jgi:hypothetical protein
MQSHSGAQASSDGPRPEFPSLLIMQPELVATLVRPRLGAIQLIHCWKLKTVG